MEEHQPAKVTPRSRIQRSGRAAAQRYDSCASARLGKVVAGISSMSLITTPSAEIVIACAIQVHRSLGPGLFESVYCPCLGREMSKAGLNFESEVTMPLIYDGIRFDKAFRADFIVEKELLVEVKSVEHVLPVHASQVLTYLRLTGLRKGLLINFNVPVLKQGLKSFVM